MTQTAEQSDVEVMARAILKAIGRAAKRRHMSPMQMLGALGAAGAFVTATAVPECDAAGDAVAVACLGMGYTEMLPIIRKAGAN